MKKSIRYMTVPMDLTDRQHFIYLMLYKKCDFANMTVKYTFDQLASDIKIIKISKDVVRRDIEKMIKEGYLKVIIKGSKGNPTIYKIIKISDLYKISECNLKVHNTNDLNGGSKPNIQNKNILTAIPIKEKENYIYSEPIQKIINLYPGKKVKYVRDKELPSIINKYGEEQIIRCVKRYCDECKSKEKQFILNESTFWKERYIDYLDQEVTNLEENENISIPDMLIRDL